MQTNYARSKFIIIGMVFIGSSNVSHIYCANNRKCKEYKMHLQKKKVPPQDKRCEFWTKKAKNGKSPGEMSYGPSPYTLFVQAEAKIEHSYNIGITWGADSLSHLQSVRKLRLFRKHEKNLHQMP